MLFMDWYAMLTRGCVRRGGRDVTGIVYFNEETGECAFTALCDIVFHKNNAIYALLLHFA